ncbi:MAG: hypothetical protein AAGD04_03590 [Pseudomonadota bacterium]
MSTTTRDLNPAQLDKQAAFRFLEAQLEAEDAFLDEVRALIKKNTGIESFPKDLIHKDFDFIHRKDFHDYLINLAQFYVSLDVHNCNTPEKVEVLLDAHNDKVRDDIKKGLIDKSPAERKKLIFSCLRMAQIREMVKHCGRAVFTVQDLSNLLDFGAARNVRDLLTALIKARILVPAMSAMDEGSLNVDPRRVPIEPIPEFVQAYSTSLWTAHEKLIMASED